jgi:hypothetical protein
MHLIVTLHVHCLSCSHTVDTFPSQPSTSSRAGEPLALLGTRHSVLPQFIFISFARPAPLYCEDYVPIYTHLTVWQTVYELQLPPNNTACETFLHKSGAVRSVDWIFIMKAPAWRWLGEYVTSDKTFCKLLFKQDVIQDPVTAAFTS